MGGKRSIWRIMALVALSVAPAAAQDGLPGPVPATVVRVVDADTLEVDARIWVDQWVRVRVRVAGVDAPEIFRPRCQDERLRAERASAFVTALGPQEVELTNVRNGSFAGRVVADVRLADGSDLAARLIAAGHGAPYEDRGDWCALAAAGGHKEPFR